jgi:hypothetical protein
MARVGMSPDKFAFGGRFEPLGRASMCFDFGH